MSNGRVSAPKSKPAERPFWLLEGNRSGLPNARVNACDVACVTE